RSWSKVAAARFALGAGKGIRDRSRARPRHLFDEVGIRTVAVPAVERDVHPPRDLGAEAARAAGRGVSAAPRARGQGEIAPAGGGAAGPHLARGLARRRKPPLLAPPAAAAVSRHPGRGGSAQLRRPEPRAGRAGLLG